MTLYVYAARPKATYGTKYGDNAIASVRRKYPKHEVLDPAKLFESHADWEQRWSGIADSLDDFVLIPNPDGTIGQGCSEEYEAVRGLGIPARLLVNEREFVDKFYVRKLDGGIWKIRFAAWLHNDEREHTRCQCGSYRRYSHRPRVPSASSRR